MVALSSSDIISIPSECSFEKENKENITLIWFDPNKELYDDIDCLKSQLRQINDYVVFHNKLETCIAFIQSIENEKIFLITSGSYVSQFAILQQIDFIFIYCSEKNQYEYLLNDYSKIIGIYDELDLLCSSIEKQIHFLDNQLYSWSFFDQEENCIRDLSKQSNDFFWLQILHDVILHLSNDTQAKKQMIHFCRIYYKDNSKELELINEFEEKYQSNQAIQWYLKNSFPRKLINKALRIKDTNQLYKLRYFLGDLITCLNNEHQQIIQAEKEKTINVYQQMNFSQDELNKFKEKKGKLISIKGFFLAKSIRPILKTSITEHINVLFEIECNKEELIFADITQFKESLCQDEILFNFNATFRLDNIEKLNEQIWLIKMTAVKDGQMIKEKYIHDIHQQIEDLSISIIFGKLLCDMSQWNQSQEYFENLLINSHNEDHERIEHCIGQALHWQGKWNEARKYYDRAYTRMIQCEPIRIKDAADILSDIGEILELQGKYDEAYDYQQQALIIRKKFYSSDHVHIAISLDNIGLIHYQQLKNDEALIFLREALQIRQIYYNYFHVDIATSLKNIACVLTDQRQHDQALEYYQQAMKIYEKYYPSGDVYIAHTMNNIGLIFFRQEKYDQALEIVQRALAMQKKFYPSGHIEIATSLCNIGNIKYGQGKYDESIDYHHQVLAMQRKYYSSNHMDIICTYNNIGYILLCGTWTIIGNMSVAREYHTASTLANGSVLVTGGYNTGSSYLNSAELYNPLTGIWTTTGSMNAARYLHTASTLANGSVLVTGGYNSGSSYLNSAELYNPSIGTWTTTRSMSAAREYHKASTLANGSVLVTGGSNSGGVLNCAELY
ncbi:unnamed protein product [Adineta steineri]|uniref:Tetratricopeptide repeat protein n=2 Tax=Adineta steineri TaxID=433720 RepID=A0A814H9M7_9BILA|nr:unnamed protein product [Adineta steineri]